MNMNYNELFKDRPCNECNGSDNVEIITIGGNGIALCLKCRNKLRKILGVEQPIGIELRNINLTGLTLVDELSKADEEEEEFKQALIGYLQDRHDISREHLLEELCDTIQVKLSTMKTIDIDIEEIVNYWNTKHLEKIKDRPRIKICNICSKCNYCENAKRKSIGVKMEKRYYCAKRDIPIDDEEFAKQCLYYEE